MKPTLGRRLRNLFMCVVMVVGLMPMTALAEKTDTSASTATTTATTTQSATTTTTTAAGGASATTSATASSTSAATTAATTNTATTSDPEANSAAAAPAGIDAAVTTTTDATAQGSLIATDAQSAPVATTQSTANAGVTMTPQSDGAVTVTDGDLAKYVTGSSLTVDGKDISGQTVNYGQAVSATINWKISNSVNVDKGDTYIYALPDGISFKDYSGNLMNGTTVDAAYTVSGNKLTITYNKNLGSDVKGSIQLDGSIEQSSTSNKDGGARSVAFPGASTYTYTIKSTASLNAWKNYSAVSGADNQYDFVIAVQSSGINKNAVVTDAMGYLLSMTNADVKVYADYDCATAYTGSYSVSGNAAGSQKFVVAFASDLVDGQTVYIKYRVTADKEPLSLAKAAGKWDQIKNTASYKSDESSEKSTDCAIQIDSTWKVSKSGADNGDGTISWTITVDPGTIGSFDGKTLVKDVLGANLDIPSTVILKSGTDGVNWGNATNVDWSALAAGTYALPAAAKGTQYQITYTTKTTGAQTGKVTYTNDATVYPGGNTDYGTNGHGEVSIGENVSHIAKTCLTADDSGYMPRWQTVVSASDKDLANAYIDDTYGSDMTFDADSLSIVDNTGKTYVEGTDYTRGTYDHGEKIKFTGTIAKGTVITLTYTTNVTNGNTSQVTNKTWMHFTGDTNESSQATYHFGKHLNKWASDYNDGAITWGLTVNKVASDATTVTVTDTLPEGTSYIDGSLTFPWNSGMTGLNVAKNSDGTVTFTFTGAALNQIKTDNLSFFYQTKIDDMSTLQNDGKNYTNKAQISVDGTTENSVDATKRVDEINLVSKSGAYDESTAPFANYAVKVNAYALTLNGGNALMLTDAMGSALTFQPGTVSFTDFEGNAVTGCSYGYDDKTNTLTFTIPDATAVKISYQVAVSAAVGTELNSSNASNTVTLTGLTNWDSSATKTLSGQVISSRGTSSCDGYDLKVYKYADGKIESKLAGATFKVEALTTTTAGSNWLTTGSSVVASGMTSGDDGYTATAMAASGLALRADTIYKVTETSAPAGYAIAPASYVVFAGLDASKCNNYEGITVDGAQLIVTTNKEQLVYVGDKVSAHDVEISKIDATTLAELPGAQLKITDAAGNAVDSWTSTNEVHKVTVSAGTYTLTETTAPSGYKNAESITFAVSDDGTVTSATEGAASGMTITMKDVAQSTPLTPASPENPQTPSNPKPTKPTKPTTGTPLTPAGTTGTTNELPDEIVDEATPTTVSAEGEEIDDDATPLAAKTGDRVAGMAALGMLALEGFGIAAFAARRRNDASKNVQN